MNRLKNVLLIAALSLSFTAKPQCGYDTLSVQIKHINCFADNTGEINLIVNNVNATFSWEGPAGFPGSTLLSINSLFAGDYILTISEYSIPGDVTSTLICQMSDTFTVNQTNDLSASYILDDICNEDDSADVIIQVTGGTPFNTGEPYNYIVTNSLSLIVGVTDTLFELPPDL